MRNDKLSKAVRSALKGTDWQKINDLLASQSRWQRKRTIAENKLEWVRVEINRLALKMAQEKNGVKDDGVKA